jgi:hypothetical protein
MKIRLYNHPWHLLHDPKEPWTGSFALGELLGINDHVLVVVGTAIFCLENLCPLLTISC